MIWSLTNTLSFLQSFCVDASITKANLIAFIQLRYERIYTKALKFYQTEGTFSTVSGTKYYYLSRELNLSRPIKFYNQSSDVYNIRNVDYDDILSRDMDENETGTTIRAAFVELSPTQRQPSETSDTSTLRVKSSSSSDTTQKVTITGRATDGTRQFEVTEELTLTGTTAVASTYTYVYIYDFSKSTDTTGYISLLDSTSANLYAIIDPNRPRAEYQKWRLWPTPTAADTIKYVGHRRQRIPQNDSALIDVPSDLEAAFIQGLRADIHDINFDMLKAGKYDAIFERALQEAIENSTWADDEEVSTADDDYRYNELTSLQDVPEDS